MDLGGGRTWGGGGTVLICQGVGYSGRGSAVTSSAKSLRWQSAALFVSFSVFFTFMSTTIMTIERDRLLVFSDWQIVRVRACVRALLNGGVCVSLSRWAHWFEREYAQCSDRGVLCPARQQASAVLLWFDHSVRSMMWWFAWGKCCLVFSVQLHALLDT